MDNGSKADAMTDTPDDTMSALTPRKKAGIERGLEDIKKGNVYHAENSADLIKQIFGNQIGC